MPRTSVKEDLDIITGKLSNLDATLRMVRVGLLNHFDESHPDVQLVDRNLTRIHNTFAALHGYEIDQTSVLRLFHETPSFREVADAKQTSSQ